MASETGRLLAHIKAETGLSWQAIADTIGASSGDYVRKVASGAKPGNNLTAVVGELLETGQVAKAAPRRRDRAGNVARVRQSRAAQAATGTPSRRPAETTVRAPKDARRVFRGDRGRMGWAQTLDAGDPDAVRAALTSAGRGRRRVVLRARVRDKSGRTRWVEIGSRGGYRPGDVAAGIRSHGGVGEWLATQTSGRTYAGTIDASSVEDIEIVAE